MTCEEFADALLDRGEPSHGITAALRAHAAHCARCAGRRQRHDAVVSDLAALARAIDVPVAAFDAMEERLAAAMTAPAVNEPAVHAVAAAMSRPWYLDWRAGAAAAVLVLAVAITWYPERPRPLPTSPKPAPTQPPREPSPRTSAMAVTPSPALATPAPAARVPVDKAPVDRAPVKSPARVPAPAAVVASTPPAPATTPANAPRTLTLSDADTRERLAAFVALPGATALPDFESGQIVRVAVPVAELPAYGLELIPHAGIDAVSVDVLVGQDGLARAMRLASFTTSTNGSRR